MRVQVVPSTDGPVNRLTCGSDWQAFLLKFILSSPGALKRESVLETFHFLFRSICLRILYKVIDDGLGSVYIVCDLPATQTIVVDHENLPFSMLVSSFPLGMLSG